MNFKPTDRLSYRQKKSNKFKAIEDIMDYWNSHLHQSSGKLKKKYQMNADLFNGRMKELYGDEEGNPLLNIEGESLELPSDFEQIHHYDILSPILKSMYGEQQKRLFKPLVVDTSRHTYNQKKLEITKQTQAWLGNILNNLREEITMSYLQEHGIESPFDLEEEEQMQMQDDIEQRYKLEEPTNIAEYMRKEYKAPLQQVGQEILTVINDEHFLKNTTDSNFPLFLTTGHSIFYTNVYEGRTHFEPVNAEFFDYFAVRHTNKIEESEACKYVREMTYTELFLKFGEELSKPKYKDILNQIISGRTNTTREGYEEAKIVAEIAAHPNQYGIKDIDIRSVEGHQRMSRVLAKTGIYKGNYSTTDATHICFRFLAKKVKVLRVDETGNIRRLWFSEGYKKDPTKGDIEAKTVYLPEIWEGETIGPIGTGIYLNKRKVPWQYRDVDDPYKLNFPYTGRIFSNLKGSSDNVAPIDLGKPWNAEFNIHLAKLKEIEALNWGKIFIMSSGMKPKNTTWGDFLKMIKYGKIAILDNISSHEAQAIKALELGSLNDIAAKLQYLEWIQQMAAKAMSYNPSRLGEVSPYMTVTNNQQNIIQSAHQTETIYSLHAESVETALNNLMRAKLYALKENPEEQTYVNSDMSVGLLQVTPELLDLSRYQIKLSMDPDEYEKILDIKRDIPGLLQSKLINFPEYIKMKFAENKGEIMNIAESSELRMQEEIEAEREARMREVEEQNKAQQEQDTRDKEFQLFMQSKDHKIKKFQAEMDSEKFAKQYDINNNNVNDTYEREMEKIKADLQKHRDEMALREKELKLKEKEIKDKYQIEMKKARAKK